MTCTCRIPRCIHARLPHLPPSVQLSVPEKRSVKEILEFFQTPDVPDRGDVRASREARGIGEVRER